MEKISKKELLYKPNQTIMITNGEITATQRKAYNVILYTAWDDLKTNPNQILFRVQIAEIKRKAGIQSTNNTELKDNIRKLRHMSVETIKENGDWEGFNLIAQDEKVDDVLEIQLPEKIRKALINNDFYTTLDLLTIKSLEGKYAIILYEMAIRYHKTQIPEMTIDELKLLTGTSEIKSYNLMQNFKVNVLKTGIDEINEKTDINLSYEMTKTGNRYTSIKFIVHTKKIDILAKQEKKIDKKIKNNKPSKQSNNVIKIPQYINFEQRTYSEEDYESFIANGKAKK